jgi:hypothetical protein
MDRWIRRGERKHLPGACAERVPVAFAGLQAWEQGRYHLLKTGAFHTMANLLWTIVVVLFVLWLLGFLLHVGGGLIHLLLLIALIVLIVNLVTGRRPAA